MNAVPEWTTADSEAAIAEGWDLFETNRADGHMEIQRHDDETSFELDGDALDHVIAKADEGSALHAKALHMHNEHNP